MHRRGRPASHDGVPAALHGAGHRSCATGGSVPGTSSLLLCSRGPGVRTRCSPRCRALPHPSMLSWSQWISVRWRFGSSGMHSGTSSCRLSGTSASGGSAGSDGLLHMPGGSHLSHRQYHLPSGYTRKRRR